MIPVGQLPPGDQWDQNMLDLLFSNQLYPTGIDFTRHDGYPRGRGCVLLIPGRYWAGKEADITYTLTRYEWVLGIRTSDEENLFDHTKIDHPNLLWWIQTPRTGVDYGESRLFGVGFPPHFNNLPAVADEPLMSVFLSAQLTHSRREWAFSVLTRMEGQVLPTGGFTQGMPRQQYTDCMRLTRVAPAPSGPVSADTFRLYEALEAHVVPVADDYSPATGQMGFWRTVFPDAPFPVITSYDDMADVVERALDGWPANANRIAAWWMRQKRLMAQWLKDDLTQLGAL